MSGLLLLLTPAQGAYLRLKPPRSAPCSPSFLKTKAHEHFAGVRAAPKRSFRSTSGGKAAVASPEREVPLDRIAMPSRPIRAPATDHPHRSPLPESASGLMRGETNRENWSDSWLSWAALSEARAPSTSQAVERRCWKAGARRPSYRSQSQPGTRRFLPRHRSPQRDAGAQR